MAGKQEGGKLGSREALASRKRLEGVTTMIAVVVDRKRAAAVETTYPHDESPAEPAAEPTPEPEASSETPSDAGVLPATL